MQQHAKLGVLCRVLHLGRHARDARGTVDAEALDEHGHIDLEFDSAVGILLVLLIPFLRRLIKDKETDSDDAPVAVVPARCISACGGSVAAAATSIARLCAALKSGRSVELGSTRCGMAAACQRRREMSSPSMSMAGACSAN